MKEQQIWTEEIKSQNTLFSINLKEVWHYRDLLLMLVKRDYVTFYKQTILGPIWSGGKIVHRWFTSNGFLFIWCNYLELFFRCIK